MLFQIDPYGGWLRLIDYLAFAFFQPDQDSLVAKFFFFFTVSALQYLLFREFGNYPAVQIQFRNLGGKNWSSMEKNTGLAFHTFG